MKYKYLYVGGDSFCITSSIRESFGQLISKYNNLELINDAMGGGSNDMILRKFINFVNKNDDKLKDTIFSITFSNEERLELWDSFNNKYVQGQRVRSELIKDEKFWTKFDKYIWIWEENVYVKNFIVPCFSIYNYLKGKKFPFVFSNTFPMNDKIIKEGTVPRDIFLDYWFDGPDVCYKRKDDGVSHAEFRLKDGAAYSSSISKYFEGDYIGNGAILDYDDVMEYGVDAHPNEQGHKIISDAIVKKFNSLYDIGLICE
jgi:hypothetical protein|tara:strand:- start:3538 stop:4311 length:774 start_codon:yes stop_codon:yes gene_type:complete